MLAPVPMSVRQSICKVRIGGRDLGTGWVLNASQVVTAAHVLVDKVTDEIQTEPIELHFPSGGFSVKSTLAIDRKLDIAVLDVELDPALALPDAINVGSVDTLGVSGPFAWYAWGFPPKINAEGMGLRGTVVADGVCINSSGATAIQLDVVQSGSDKMGGMSGAPVMVGDICIGLIRQYPPNLAQGTLYAASIRDGSSSLPALGDALNRCARLLPVDLQNLVDLQADWTETMRPLQLRGTGASPYVFVEQVLINGAGTRIGLGELERVIAETPGVLIRGAPGAGKSRLLAEFLRRLVRNEHPTAAYIPLMISATECTHASNFFETMAEQRGRFSQPFINAARLRELTTSGQFSWVFLIDALDEAAVTAQAAEALGNYLASLDRFCRQYGHAWVATQRSQGPDLNLPNTTTILGIRDWDASQAQQLIQIGMGRANGESPIEVYLSLPPLIARNPLLLNASLQLAGRPGKGVAKGSPASILYRFLDSIFEEAQAQYFAKNVDPRLEKILAVLPLLTIASTLAVAHAKGEDPLEQVSELIDQQCRLGYHAACRATATITEQILYRSNMACVNNDGLEWSHLLYRDTLIAIMLADRYTAEPAILSQALERAEKTRNYNAPAMALVLMENKLEVDEIFDRLGEFDAVSLVVSFLSLGGSLGEKNLAPFIALLREGAHMDKHRVSTCQYVLSHAYAPIECLMSLCFIASAREVLEEIAGDVAVEPSLREEIAARLGGSS